MSKVMNTEDALSNINDRIANTDLKETYFVARLANENVTVDDDDYTVDMLEDTEDRLRTVLTEYLFVSETALDNSYEAWKAKIDA